MLTKWLYLLPQVKRDRIGGLLEHGLGDFSSQVMANFAAQLEIPRYFIENKEVYIKQYAYGCKQITINEIPSYNIALALVDGDTNERMEVLKALPKGVLVVVHDTEFWEVQNPNDPYKYNFNGFDILETSYVTSAFTHVLKKR